MTREEAMQILRETQPKFARCDREARQQIAIRMAIEALKERKAGKWIPQINFGNHRRYACSLCGKEGFEGDKYCSNCGAKMEVDDADSN